MYHSLKWQSSGTNTGSLANRFRKQRMRIVEYYFDRWFHKKMENGDTISILDIGGTYQFWSSSGFKYLDCAKITLANISNIEVPDEETNFESVYGDATDLSVFSDKSFDLVFSNSCIEHIGKMPEWKKMSSEMMRLGKYYYLQTPNKYFPMEPHFLIPGFQFLPLNVQVSLLEHFDVGNYSKAHNHEDAVKKAKSVCLLSYHDLRTLFPDAKILREKYFGATKSYMVVGKCK